VSGDPRLWRTHGPDILDRSAAERRRLGSAFTTWLQLLSGPLTMIICCRRLPKRRWGGELFEPAAARSELPGPPPGDDEFSRTTYLLVAPGTNPDALRLLESLQASCQVETSPASRLPALGEGPWSERGRALLVGGRWLSSLRMAGSPGVEVEAGWLWELASTPGEFDLAVRVVPRPQAAADRSLRRRLRGLLAQELVGSLSGPDPRLEVAAHAARELRQVLARSGGRLFHVEMTVSLCGDSAAEVKAMVAGFRTRAAALRMNWTPAWFDELPARLETLGRPLPGGRPQILMPTEEVGTLWPWVATTEPGVEEQTVIGRHQRTGALVTLEAGHQDGHPNRNLAVVAASGGGKSYLAGLVGLEAARRGQAVVVLDPENEHGRWCSAVGGEYLDLAQSPGCGFNALELGSTAEALALAVDLIDVLTGPLSQQERSAALRAATHVIESSGPHRAGVLGDCLARLEQEEVGRDLAGRLAPWVTGEAGLLFSSPGRGPSVRTSCVIGLRDLPESWLAGATLLVSAWLNYWLKAAPGVKQIIVDEAGLLSDVAALRSLMARLARRARKYQGSLMLLTQTGSDLTGSSFGEVVAVNAATVLLGAQQELGARRLQQAFGLDDSDRMWLQQAGRGDFLMVSDTTRTPVRVEAPQRYRAWLGAGRSQE